jgi:hypothetical protein
MRRPLGVSLLLALAFATAAPRWTPEKKEGGRARVSLYRVVPAQQLEFLKWLAAREEVGKAAGIAPSQLYAHLDGDAWDYLLIAPVTSDEQERKFDEVARTKGVKTGFAASLEFRQLLSWHTDTLVVGPSTAADLVAEVSK